MSAICWSPREAQSLALSPTEPSFVAEAHSPPSCLVPTCVEAKSQRLLFTSFQSPANADTQSSTSVSCQLPCASIYPQRALPTNNDHKIVRGPAFNHGASACDARLSTSISHSLQNFILTIHLHRLSGTSTKGSSIRSCVTHFITLCWKKPPSLPASAARQRCKILLFKH